MKSVLAVMAVSTLASADSCRPGGAWEYRPASGRKVTAGSAVGWLGQRCAHVVADLLHGPVVSVRVGEVKELPAVPGVQDLHSRDIPPTAGQLGPAGVDVRDP